ncbi:MAG TPA: HD domain-containing protein [Clostridia bacterium]|nr:HD domain-containing protein [Clostridia bacterium]
MVPTRQMCEQMWEDKGLTDGLKKHLAAVADLAVRIGTALNQKGFALNIPLIEAAALLHDIEKGIPHHAVTGAKTLETLGFTEIAPIVKFHMRLPDGFQPEITELTVVFLADKLFIGSQSVSLQKRYAEKLSAYQDDPPALQTIRKQLEISLNLEKRMKTVLGVDSLILLS